MTTKDIVERIGEAFREASNKLSNAEAKKAEAEENENWEHWLQFYALDFVFAQKLSKKWETIYDAVLRMEVAGHSGEDIKEYLKGIRDAMVQTILTVDGSRSTNVISNELARIEHDVLKSIVGASIINPVGLNGIINDMEKA